MLNLKTKWENLSAKKKRNIVVIGGVVVVIGALYFLIPQDTVRVSGETNQVIQSVLTDADTAGASQAAVAARLRSLADSQTKIADQMDKIVRTFDMKVITTHLNNIEQQIRDEKTKREQLESRLRDAEKALKNPVIINQPGNTAAEDAKKNPESARTTELNQIYNSLPAGQSAVNGAAGSSGSSKEAILPEIETVMNSSDKTAQADKETADSDDDSFEVYLPPTSIVSGVLISGMDAPTSQNSRRDPYPSLIRIKKDALLPNRFRLDIRECGILASGFGELSSERAFFRSEVISCVRDDGAVFESPLTAFAVGEDGKIGLRGRLVSKQGQLLAKALTAGFLQAASQLFSVKSMPTINLSSDGSGGNPYQQVLNSTSLQGAAVSGAGEALSRLADFYMKMADDIFPIIEIDPGRSVDFIVQSGVTLKFHRTGDKK